MDQASYIKLLWLLKETVAAGNGINYDSFVSWERSPQNFALALSLHSPSKWDTLSHVGRYRRYCPYMGISIPVYYLKGYKRHSLNTVVWSDWGQSWDNERSKCDQTEDASSLRSLIILVRSLYSLNLDFVCSLSCYPGFVFPLSYGISILSMVYPHTFLTK